MKRFLLSGLAALAILATSVTSASASCVNADGSSSNFASSTWPYGAYTQVCNGDTTNGSLILSTIAAYSSTSSIADANARFYETFSMPQPGDVIKLTVTDSTLILSPFPFSYTVQPGDTLQTVMSNLANQINSMLSTSGISAQLDTPSGPTFAQITTTGLATTYVTADMTSATSESMDTDPFTIPDLVYNYDVFTLSGGTSSANLNVPIYLFDDYTQVNGSSLVSADPSGCVMSTIASDNARATAFGYTYKNPATNTPCQIILNESVINGSQSYLTSVANTVSHELGHVLAYIYARDGILADNTTFGVTDASSTQLWQHTGAKDITYLNDQYPCYDYNFNENGLFTWMTDLLGNEFCTDGGTGSIRTQPGFVGPGDPGDGATLDSTTSINLPPPSTSTTTYAAAASAAVGNGAGPNGNLGVLALNQPNIFGKHNGDGTFDSYAIAREIFAETFANVSGNPTPLNYMNTFDLGGSWGPCSQDIGFDLFYGGSYAYWISSPQTIYYFPNVDSTNWSTLTCPAN